MSPSPSLSTPSEHCGRPPTVNDAELELLAALSSPVVLVEVAVLVTLPTVPVLTVASICSTVLEPLASAPIDHMPVDVAYVVPVEVASEETNVRAAGSTSVTDTPVAAAGPPFVTVSVYVTVAPTCGFVGLTVFVSDTSEDVALESVLVTMQLVVVLTLTVTAPV